MNPDGANRVPKIHPLEREAGVEDPLELVATPVVGDPDVMLECILQEFIWMGWNRDQLLALFHDPGYPMLCELHAYFGASEIERRVTALLAGGQLRFRECIAEPDDDDEFGHEDACGRELVQITLPPQSHAC